MDVPEYLRFFPHDAPYDTQREAMDRIATALSGQRNVLFEGAPGTGKTLAALVPALAYAGRTDKTVVITTNVHQQMRQFIAEARSIARSEPIRAVVFRGKASMCHIDVGYEECQLLRDNTHELVDLETERRELADRQRLLLSRSQEGDAAAGEARATVMAELESVEDELAAQADRRTCSHYYNNLAVDTAAFERWLFDDVRTPDDVYAFADEKDLCGYELLKEAMGGVDLVVCNYRHLLDEAIRRQFFRWLDRDPEDVIVVFDEAHNIPRAARDYAARTVSQRTLERAIEELSDVDDPRAQPAANVIGSFLDALVRVYGTEVASLPDGSIDTEWNDLSIDNEDRRDDLTLAFLGDYSGRGIEEDIERALALGRTLEERYAKAYRTGDADTRHECPTLEAATFIEAYLQEAPRHGQYPVVSVRRDDRPAEIYGRAELYTCIPRDVTRSLFEAVHASVLMSATLRPFDVTADVLGLPDPATQAYGLGFPRENRRTFAVDVPPLFAADREDPDVQSAVAGVLEDTIRFTPGNTLVFFPSYGEAARYRERVDVEATVYLDEPGTAVESLRKRFVDGTNGALFTSLWGTLTEGVSFDGDAAHTVAVVGVPYPRLSDRLEAVQRAYDDAFATPDAGWLYGVEIPTIRKTRQALGRVLRSPTDIGVRILADRRYTDADMGRYGVRDTFPAEEQEEFIDVDPEKLKFALFNFYASHDVYDGSQPVP